MDIDISVPAIVVEVRVNRVNYESQHYVLGKQSYPDLIQKFLTNLRHLATSHRLILYSPAPTKKFVMASRCISRSCSQLSASTSSSAARAFLQVAPRRTLHSTPLPVLEFLLPSLSTPTRIWAGSNGSTSSRSSHGHVHVHGRRAFVSSSRRLGTVTVYNPKKDEDGKDMSIEITARASKVRLSLGHFLSTLSYKRLMGMHCRDSKKSWPKTQIRTLRSEFRWRVAAATASNTSCLSRPSLLFPIPLRQKKQRPHSTHRPATPTLYRQQHPDRLHYQQMGKERRKAGWMKTTLCSPQRMGLARRW